jgi:peptide/nickel transport system substrate-binding protein
LPTGGSVAVPVETATPAPTAIPRILTVCTGEEPQDLFLYAGRSLAKNHVLEAIYDGPIDSNGYDYQPVILEKLPSLEDGDAAVEAVAVEPGDWVMNDAGSVAPLARGQVVRPFGCTQAECAVAWDGGPLEMAQLSATYTLLPGLQWSDGEPLTADDSVFSFSIARQCELENGPCGGAGLASGNPWTAERTASYTALDERSLRWTGVPGFLDPDYRTNFFHPLPEHQLEGISPADLFQAEQNQLPLGWGPYLLDRWVPGDHIRLLKNPGYFRAGEGLPTFDMLIFRFIGQDADRNLAAVSSGMCDALDQSANLALAGAAVQDLLDRQAGGDLAAHFVAGPVWEQAAFGLQPLAFDDGYQPGADPPALFNDVRTRRAIAMCIDRQRIVETLLQGQAEVPVSYVPAEHPLYNPEVAQIAFDPQAAAALLQEVGWIDDDGDVGTPRLARGIPFVIDGTPLAFTYRTSQAELRRQAAEILAESLAGCGIEVNLEFSEVEQLYAPGPEGPLFGRRFEMAQLAWATGMQPPCDLFTSNEVPGAPQGSWIPFGGLEARPFPRGWGGQNETGYSNPEYDRACRAALEALPGEPGFAESHAQAQQIFAADLPVVPLYRQVKLAVTRPDFCGFELDPTARSEMWNIENFDVGEGCP